MARFLSIISGSHAVGKTTLAINIATHLQTRGKRVLLLTEDTRWLTTPAGSASLVVKDLKKMIADRENLAAHIITGPLNIELIVLRLARGPDKNMNPELIQAFCEGGGELDTYDFFLLDITGGLTQTALACCLSPCDTILVATPEPKVLNQTLKLLKVMAANGFHDPLKLVVAQAQDKHAAEETYMLIEETAARRFHIPLEYIGYVGQLPLNAGDAADIPLLTDLDEKRGEYFEFLAAFLDGSKETFHGELSAETFLARMIELLSYPLQMPSTEIVCKSGGIPEKLEFSLNNKEMIPLFESIVEHLGRIGNELATIRNMFETEMSGTDENRPPFHENGGDTKIIPLDLEIFASEMNASKSNNNE